MGTDEENLLGQLPIEILVYILKFLEERDLKKLFELASVCQLFYGIVKKHLLSTAEPLVIDTCSLEDEQSGRLKEPVIKSRDTSLVTSWTDDTFYPFRELLEQFPEVPCSIIGTYTTLNIGSFESVQNVKTFQFAAIENSRIELLDFPSLTKIDIALCKKVKVVKAAAEMVHISSCCQLQTVFCTNPKVEQVALSHLNRLGKLYLGKNVKAIQIHSIHLWWDTVVHPYLLDIFYLRFHPKAYDNYPFGGIMSQKIHFAAKKMFINTESDVIFHPKLDLSQVKFMRLYCYDPISLFPRLGDIHRLHIVFHIELIESRENTQLLSWKKEVHTFVKQRSESKKVTIFSRQRDVFGTCTVDHGIKKLLNWTTLPSFYELLEDESVKNEMITNYHHEEEYFELYFIGYKTFEMYWIFTKSFFPVENLPTIQQDKRYLVHNPGNDDPVEIPHLVFVWSKDNMYYCVRMYGKYKHGNVFV